MIRSRTTRRAVAVLLAAVATLAACGGDDDDAAVDSGDPPAAGTGSGGGSDDDAGDEPTLTIPEAYLPAIRDLSFEGDPLPALNGATIEADPARGRPAPVVHGVDFDDNPVTIDAATDGPTMVALVAHWCPHCNNEIPRITALRDQGRLPADLNIVAIATSSEPSRPNFPPGEWLEELDWTWPVIVDDVDLAAGSWVSPQLFGIDGFPFVVLIDGDGNVAARWSGESDADEIVARIEEHLGLSV